VPVPVILKQAAAWLLWGSGVASLARRLLTRRRRFVLVFHGVGRVRYRQVPAELQPSLTSAELRSVLAWVGERFSFLTATELLESDRPGVLLTFDDGLANNYTNVLPVLTELEAPAVFFVTTQHVIRPDDWLPATRRQLAEFWNPAQQIPREIAADLFDGMSREQLANAGRHPLVEIGSHSVSHPWLTRCAATELEFELQDSRKLLQQVSGQPVDLFAYPTGDYDRRVAEAVRAAGYRAAFAVDSQGVGLPAFEIPRIGIYAPGRPYLGAKLSGLHRRPLPGKTGTGTESRTSIRRSTSSS
jgi:peptidoglycan/xylan/chitin deacetylase (PgdA/CDA1 family)